MEWKHNKYTIRAKVLPNNDLFEVTKIYYRGKLIYENKALAIKKYGIQKTLFSFIF